MERRSGHKHKQLTDLHVEIDQVRHARRLERIEQVRTRLSRATALKNSMVEHHAYPREIQHTSHIQTVEKVGPSVTAGLGEGYLRARDEDRFARMGEEEGKDGGGIGEGVCSGQNDEPFVEVPVFGNECGYGVPFCSERGLAVWMMGCAVRRRFARKRRDVRRCDTGRGRREASGRTRERVGGMVRVGYAELGVDRGT